jgi:hypothetical protein
LGFVFIDGGHKFPLPIVDFHFTEKRIPVGGVLCIDDLNISTVRMLYDFVMAENEWEETCRIRDTSFLKKVGETRRKGDWAAQKYNFLQENAVLPTSLYQRVVCKLRRVMGRVFDQ